MTCFYADKYFGKIGGIGRSVAEGRKKSSIVYIWRVSLRKEHRHSSVVISGGR